MTRPVCKPLLPVYDKPLVYYPLAVLIQAEIRDVLIIVPPGEIETFRALLGNGETFGMRLSYAEQSVPRGIADAFLVGREFIGDDTVCLILGDNIFHAPNLRSILKRAVDLQKGAMIFGYWVEDPRPFGVVEFDGTGRAISIEEKPARPKSNYIVPGLYFYDQQVMGIVEHLQPSARGELEITDVNLRYMQQEQLEVIPLERNVLWMDAGTADSLFCSAQIVRTCQQESGRYIGCLEELALENGWLTQDEVHATGEQLNMTLYGKYLQCL